MAIHYPSSDEYVELYDDEVAARWDAVIDWPRRAAGEGDFFVRLLRDNGVRTVLDVATGTGYHSVRLLEAGFETISVDGSAAMLAQAVTNARAHGYDLRAVHADWRQLTDTVSGPFDAVVCLGNSFNHLFNLADQRSAMGQFMEVLAEDGLLVVDHRNYDRLLDGGDLAGSRDYYYCAPDVDISVAHLDAGLARLRYRMPDRSQFHVDMFPLRLHHVRSLLTEAGFRSMETFGDFRRDFAADEVSFYVHAARRGR